MLMVLEIAVSLEGKIAIIVGGGWGIGRATALLLAERGASVVVSDIAVSNAQSVSEEILLRGGKASFHPVDINDEDQIAVLLRHTIDTFGGVDILHNNAALLDPKVVAPDSKGSVVEMDPAFWDRVFAVNVRGLMLTAKHAIPVMIERGGGAIVNTSSIASLQGRATLTAYGVSKAAVNTLSLYIATAYGRCGIRCNAVAPGYIETENAANLAPETVRQQRARHTLTPYLGKPSDIAYAVAFLVSEEARYITGQVIAVDGGVTAHAPWFAEELEMQQ